MEKRMHNINIKTIFIEKNLADENYGSSKVEISKVQSATWVRDGVQYQLLQTDSTLSRDELTAMVEEILNK